MGLKALVAHLGSALYEHLTQDTDGGSSLHELLSSIVQHYRLRADTCSALGRGLTSSVRAHRI